MTKPDACVANVPLAALTSLYGAPITLDEAALVADAARAEAQRHGWPMVIAITDSGGHLVLLYRLDQAQHGSVLVAQQKAKTAVFPVGAIVLWLRSSANVAMGLHLLDTFRPPGMDANSRRFPDCSLDGTKSSTTSVRSS
ncbi:hypothetical protein ACVME8_007134 [Bradyrhizobium diazoefficiens]